MSDDRITFQCDTCGKTLRAPIRKAGAEADCPQCGERVRVPNAPAAWAEEDDGLLGSFAGPDEIVCPVCGETTDPDAAACPSCGELLGGMGDDPTGLRRGGPTEVTLGSVWHSATEDWKEHFGILLGGFALAGLISTALLFTLYFGFIMLMFGGIAVVGGAGGGGEAAGALVIVLAICGSLLFCGAIAAVNCWMTLGLAGMHLEAVRSRPDLGTLFRSPGFWRMLLCGTIVGVFAYALSMVTVFGAMGLLFGLNGGPAGGGGGELVFILLMYGLMFVVNGGFFILFWPIPFLCLDRPDVGHVKPIWRSLTMPAGSWGGHFAVGAAAYGILLFSSLFTCGIGLLFAGPLAGLMLAHTYDRFDRAETDARGPRMLDPEGLF